MTLLFPSTENLNVRQQVTTFVPTPRTRLDATALVQALAPAAKILPVCGFRVNWHFLQCGTAVTDPPTASMQPKRLK
jgi:hypothetical protein